MALGSVIRIACGTLLVRDELCPSLDSPISKNLLPAVTFELAIWWRNQRS
jgi:hypothetical protein